MVIVVTVPLVLLVGAAVFLLVARGGWDVGQVVTGTVFGLVLASTAVGVLLTSQIEEIAASLMAWVTAK